MPAPQIPLSLVRFDGKSAFEMVLPLPAQATGLKVAVKIPTCGSINLLGPDIYGIQIVGQDRGVAGVCFESAVPGKNPDSVVAT